MDYVDCTPNFFLDSTTKLTIASSSLESASELRSPKFYLDCTSSLEELSGTPSKPRIVPGIEATRRQKNSYGKPDNFNYASRNEVPGPGSNIAVIEAKRHGDQQDDSPTRATIDNASLMDDTTRATDPFNSFQPISRPISKTSFVGYRRRTNYTNEYLIAKVENIVDFLTQYELKLLKRTQYPYNRIYYTWDEEESHEFTTRMNLVLLKPPLYSYETRGKTRDDTQLEHKYYFPTKIEEDIETFFNENTVNTY